VATLTVSFGVTLAYFVISGLILGNAWVGKSYSNSGLHLAFRYPASYSLEEQVSELDHFAVYLTLPVLSISFFSPKTPPPIAVDVYDNPGNQSLMNWLQSDRRSSFRLSGGTTTVSALSGHLTYRYDWGSPYVSTTVATAVGNKIYLFTVDSAGPDNAVRNDFSFLLGSVKFGKVS